MTADVYLKRIDDKLAQLAAKESQHGEICTDSIISTQKEILGKIQKLEDKAGGPVCQPLYSDMVKNAGTSNFKRVPMEKRNTNEVILVYSKEKESMTSETVRKAMQEKLKPSAMKVGIDKMRKVAGGGVAIELSNKGDATVLEEHIAKALPQLITKRPKKRWPHVVIYSVQMDIAKEELGTLIYQQNEDISNFMSEEDFNKQFIAKFTLGKHSAVYKNWVVEVSPTLQRRLINGNKINVEWSRCRIADFCPVLQCFKCLEYNHAAKDCPHNEPICSHCAENHVYKECPNRGKEPLCYNCKKGKNSNCKHNARDSSCPIYMRIKSNIAARTEYGPD
ncbi:uncharacterized protein LOC111615712 [Centruroides sculpturatus]|uniref:uncharacterized protein LOC111615712 n=1 Tax=Centruroides sculpturatus TaxID=218467 RepID=UPI000C6E0B05|nr:uncharacterized protein LOC111615712 [Centruroides sculpturatus]